MHEKHVEASKYLHEGFKTNGGVYIKIGQILASVNLAFDYKVDLMWKDWCTCTWGIYWWAWESVARCKA